MSDPLKRSKPPLGPVPEYIWKLNRIKELSDAIHRYTEAQPQLLPNAEWAEELAKLIREQLSQ